MKLFRLGIRFTRVGLQAAGSAGTVATMTTAMTLQCYNVALVAV
jgi:hypothetical protein